MLGDLRRAQILADARESGGVSLRELSRRFEVSIPTIRRDLSALAEQGLVRRVHGGAVALRPDRSPARAHASATAAAGSGLRHAAARAPALRHSTVDVPARRRSAAGGFSGSGAAVGRAGAHGAGTDGAAANGAAAHGVVADGEPADGATANGVVADGATADSATANGAAADGATADGATANGAAADGATADGAFYVARPVVTPVEAAAMVTPGMAIGISGGPTAVHLAGLLDDVRDLTVVTPVPAVAAAVANRATVVVLVGGVRTPSGSHAGPLTRATLRQLNLDLAFVEVPDPATTGDPLAAQTDLALLQRATAAVFLRTVTGSRPRSD